MPPDRASTGHGRLFGGELNSAIVNAVVGVHSRRLRRGPTGASAFYRDNVVVVLMEDGLPKPSGPSRRMAARTP